jgi:hypothetical protein
MSVLALLGDEHEERALKEVVESRVWWRTPETSQHHDREPLFPARRRMIPSPELGHLDFGAECRTDAPGGLRPAHRKARGRMVKSLLALHSARCREMWLQGLENKI